MSPTTIAIVSVAIIAALMIAVKLLVGKVLHDKDRRHDVTENPDNDSPKDS